MSPEQWESTAQKLYDIFHQTVPHEDWQEYPFQSQAGLGGSIGCIMDSESGEYMYIIAFYHQDASGKLSADSDNCIIDYPISFEWVSNTVYIVHNNDYIINLDCTFNQLVLYMDLINIFNYDVEFNPLTHPEASIKYLGSRSANWFKL